MVRVFRIIALVVILAVGAAPVADGSVSKSRDSELAQTLASLWKTILETPTAENPFGNGGPASACIPLDVPGDAAVISPFGRAEISCNVSPGTRIFVVGWSSECSTFEDPPYYGKNEGQLRSCARKVDRKLDTPSVAVDGAMLVLTEVETPLIMAVLPDGNIFDADPDTQGQSVGHGWVALLNPLSPGEHEISGHVTGTYIGEPFDTIFHTTIVVE